jgi:hypothetical protein
MDRTIKPIPETSMEPASLKAAPLCQAKRKHGRGPCGAKAVRGKRVCFMHGGASAGAPRGKRNGRFRHGGDTKEAVALRSQVAKLLRTLAGPDQGELEGRNMDAPAVRQDATGY